MQAALLLLGCKPHAKSGTKLALELEWTLEGRIQRVPVEELLLERRTQKAPGPLPWVFTGSRFVRLPGDIGQPASHDGPVLFETVPKASAARVVGGIASLTDPAQRAAAVKPFIAAGERLVARSVFLFAHARGAWRGNAQSKSTCTHSPEPLSMRMFSPWRSPRPITWPTMLHTAAERAKVARASNQAAGSAKERPNHTCSTAGKRGRMSAR